jgi:hypothetical protein
MPSPFFYYELVLSFKSTLNQCRHENWGALLICIVSFLKGGGGGMPHPLIKLPPTSQSKKPPAGGFGIS